MLSEYRAVLQLCSFTQHSETIYTSNFLLSYGWLVLNHLIAKVSMNIIKQRI